MMNKSEGTWMIIGGTVTLVGSAIAGILATPKACYKVAAKKEELKKDKLSPKEFVKATWKCYVPTALGIAGGVTLTIMGLKKQEDLIGVTAGLAASATATAKAVTANVAETLGEKKAKEITNVVAKDKLKENEEKLKAEGKNKEVVFVKDNQTMMFDAMTGRYFTGDIDEIKKAINCLNSRYPDEEEVTINDLYNLLDLPTCRLGDLMGWKLNDNKVRIDFCAELDEHEKPIIVLMYEPDFLL